MGGWHLGGSEDAIGPDFRTTGCGTGWKAGHQGRCPDPPGRSRLRRPTAALRCRIGPEPHPSFIEIFCSATLGDCDRQVERERGRMPAGRRWPG